MRTPTRKPHLANPPLPPFALVLVLALAAVPGCATRGQIPEPPAASAADPSAPLAELPVEVRSYPDTEAPDQKLKLEDRAYELPRAECKIQWNVITWKKRPKELALLVRDTCEQLELGERMSYYKEILNRIAKRYDVKRIRRMDAFGFGKVLAWQERMALASLESKSWRKFLLKREKSRKASANDVFVEVFNQKNVAQELTELFAARGLRLALKGADQVMEARFKDLVFSQGFPAHANSTRAVMIGAGLCHFRATPAPVAAGPARK